MEAKQVKPIGYFIHAFIVFALLGSEFLVMALNRIIDGRDMSQLFSWPINWYAVVFHWAVTILIWGVGALIFIRWAKNKKVFSELINFTLDKRGILLLILGSAFVVIYSLIQANIAGHTIPQIYREFLGFKNMYGDKALIVSLFQNVYYVFEFVLVIIMIAFFQKTGEMWFKINKIPWGSLGLMLTWGSIHFVTNPDGALGVMIFSVLAGIIYVLGKKSFYPLYLVLLLGFII
jgi:hypothetical protein